MTVTSARLKYLFEAGGGVLVWSYHGQKEAMKEIKKRAKGKLTHLSKTDFIVIVDDPEWGEGDPKADNWDPYEIEMVGVTDGAWDFTWKKRSLDVYNYGDRLVVQFTPKIVGPPEARDKVQEGVRKWVEKNQISGTTMDVRRDENDENRLIIAMTILIDGKIKGEKIGKAYWEFVKNKAALADRQVKKLTKELVKDLSTYGGLQYITGPELLLAIDDDLSGLEAESQAPEGSWEFTYLERSLELHNHGDHVVFSYVREIPKGTEASR